MIMFCGETVLWTCIICTMDKSGIDLAKESGTDNMNFMTSEIFRGQHQTSSSWREANNVPATSKPLKARFKRLFKDARRLFTDEQWYFEVYLSKVVTPFNTRNFTFSSDLPRAFEGAAQYLFKNTTRGRLFDQGACLGLPLACMPHALTWYSDENLRSREPAPLQDANVGPDCYHGAAEPNSRVLNSIRLCLSLINTDKLSPHPPSTNPTPSPPVPHASGPDTPTRPPRTSPSPCTD